MKRLNVKNWMIVNARQFSLLVFAILALLAGIGGYSLRNLKSDYSVRQFINSKNAMLMAEDKVKNDFGLPQYPYLFVNVSMASSEPADFLSPERIAALKAATEDAATFSGVKSAVSVATVEGALSVQGALTVGKIVELTPASSWSNRVLHDPLLSPSLISKDARSTLTVIGLEEVDTKIMGSLPDQLRKTFQKQFPLSTVRIGGIPAIQGEMGKLLKDELRNFLLLGLLACLVTLFAFFKDKPSLFMPLFLVALANIAALSLMTAARIPFTVLSTTLPVLVSIIVLSMVTHTMINFAGDYEQSKRVNRFSASDKVHVVIKTMRSLFLPNFLTALTTSLGFLALLGSGVPLIHDYALSVAMGVMIAWVCVMIALPAILVLMPVPTPRSWTASKARWSLHLDRYKKAIVLGVAVLALGLMYKGSNLNWSARLFDDLPRNHEARVTSEWIDQNLGAIIPLDLVIRSKTADAWNDPELAQKLSHFTKAVRATSGVGSAVALSDFIEAGARAQNQKMPATRAGVAELLFLYSLSPERITSQFLTGDGMQTRIAIRIRDLPGNEMKAVVEQIKAKAQSEFPGFEVESSGMAANVHLINNELCKDLIYGFWQAILLISLVLLIIFKSFRWTVVAIVPNLISPIVLMGTMAMTATPIKPGIALIFSIALGIAYNNTVYLLGRVRLLKNKALARGEDLKAMPVLKAWYQEGNPCVFSTLALVGGFGVFMASYFELNRLFGAYMLLSIFAGMLGDLIFLPALLSWFPKLLEVQKKAVLNLLPETPAHSFEPCTETA